MNSLTQSRKKSNSGPNTNWIKLYLTGFDVTRLGDVFRMGDVQKINFIYSNPEVVDWIYVGDEILEKAFLHTHISNFSNMLKIAVVAVCKSYSLPTPVKVNYHQF